MTEDTPSGSYGGIAGWYDQHLRHDPIFRDVVLPALLELVGPVVGQRICDVACGQGWLARELASRGAQVVGFDIASELLAIARRYEREEPLGIAYMRRDARSLRRMRKSSFDGAVCVLALMNIPNLPAVFQTIRKILKDGGWLVFVIMHPCYETPQARWMISDEGDLLRGVRAYFEEGFWISSTPGVTHLVGQYHRTLTTYLNELVAAGFTFERMDEPKGAGAHAEQVPGSLQVPRLVLVRARAAPERSGR